MGKEEIKAKRVPAPSGLFSRGITVSNPKKLIFLSGTVGYQGGGIKGQTLEAYRNMDALLKEAGATWDNVVKFLVFIKDIEKNFAGFNEARREYFEEAGINPPYPASTAVEAKLTSPPSAPPEGFLLEMELTAVIN